MADLTLHYAIPSRGLVVHWMLEELGEPYEKHIISLADNEHKTQEFLAINPLGRVPVLTHGEQTVFETGAILTYLADAFPDAGLAPAVDSPLRADYLKWLFFAPVTMEPAILWRSLGEVKTESDYRPFVPLDEVVDALCVTLRDRQYIVGDSFTAADIMVGASIMWGTTLMPLLPDRKELTDYWGHLSSRPAWQRAWEHDQAHMAASPG